MNAFQRRIHHPRAGDVVLARRPDWEAISGWKHHKCHVLHANRKRVTVYLTGEGVCTWPTREYVSRLQVTLGNGAVFFPKGGCR